jgi:WD40 repeat protein
MTRQNAIQTIEGPCRINNIEIEPGFSEALLEKLNPDTPEVELTWLQIYLDKIMRLAEDEDHSVKKISIDLLHKAGDVKDILGSFLEEQIAQLSDPDTGLVVLKSFVSVKGTKRQITEEEVIDYSGTFGKEIDSETIKELIQRFIRLRILRDQDEDGKYELRHDSLASKIFEKITIVEKELLEVKYFIDNAYSNYEKRHLLLSDEDLKYIAPYEDKLFLNDKYLRFISQSKQAFQKARRRRQNIAIAAASLIIVILSAFTIYAMKERGNAITQQKVAENQKNLAVKAKEEADASRQEAVALKQIADSTALIAFAARNQSEIARKEALAAKENALQQKTRAEQMSALANEQARKAEEEKGVADQQMILAQAAEEKAKRLGLLSTAQNLALTSMSLEKKPEIMGLLAVQAFNFNINNGGAVDDPVIFEALDKAYSVLDRSKHSVFLGSANEIRSLAENDSNILGADMDGNLIQWNSEGNFGSVPNTRLQSYINFISLSPSGKMILTGYENNQIILRNLNQNDQSGTELHGHTGPVKAVAWNNDGNSIATGGEDSLILIWKTGSNASEPVKKIIVVSPVKSLVFCGTDSLISAHDDGSIIVWNLNKTSGEILYPASIEKALCIAWDSSRGNLLAGTSNGTILIFFLHQKLDWFGRLASHTTGIDNMVFNRDFSLVATSAWDKVIRLYNYHEFFELHDLVRGVKNIDNLDSRARSMIFTKDNKLIAGMSNKSIRLWETSLTRLASMICQIVNRDMISEEWTMYVGSEIPYEKTCGMNH